MNIDKLITAARGKDLIDLIDLSIEIEAAESNREERKLIYIEKHYGVGAMLRYADIMKHKAAS